MFLHNTLTGKKEIFEPLEKNVVGIYNCGPTVYDTVHIGNLRTFFMYDIVRRAFEYNGFLVKQVMNVTDVDDKTIKKSQEKGISLDKLTSHYETLFLADLHSMNILTPHHLLRAKDHIKEMVNIISVLLENDIAYQTKDGIYFSIGLSKNYGRLAKINLSGEVRERIANDEYEKENPRDFALWKFATEEDGEAIWEAPFGNGRPGWHIECSAMALKALGETIDVHTGGSDLIFPHHTNEIAQSESATGKTFVRYWLHGAYMNINDDKMAKSKGNFFKLKDLENKGISSLGFRYWLLTSHYRSPVNFTIEAVKGAQNGFIRLVEAFIRLKGVNVHEHIHGASTRDYKKEFLEKINDDLNLPEALALTWDLIKDSSVESKTKVELILDFDNIFGLGLKAVANIKEEIPEEINALVEVREEARENKEWDKADALRKEIEKRGFEIKDLEKGVEVRKK